MANNKNKSTRLRLLGDRVLVKVIKAGETKTSSGIILGPVSEEYAAAEGEVIQMSRQCREELKEDEKFDVGDILLFGQHAGTKVIYKNTEYKILRSTDLYSVVDPEID